MSGSAEPQSYRRRLLVPAVFSRGVLESFVLGLLDSKRDKSLVEPDSDKPLIDHERLMSQPVRLIVTSAMIEANSSASSAFGGQCARAPSAAPTPWSTDRDELPTVGAM